MNREISEVLQQLHKAIDDDREGELSLGWRIAIWSAMADTFGAEAQLRRSVLAFAVARDMMPIWNSGQLTCGPLQYDLFFQYPANSLAVCRQYLRGEVPLETIERQCERMWSDEDEATYHVTDFRMEFVYAAVLSLFSCISKGDDEAYEDRGWYETAKDPESRSEIREALFGEMEWCETHYWASRAGMYVEDNDIYDPTPETFARRRIFWHQWVRESLPKVLGPMERCLAVLDEV